VLTVMRCSLVILRNSLFILRCPGRRVVDEVIGQCLFAIDDGGDERLGGVAVVDCGDMVEGSVPRACEVVHRLRGQWVIWQIGSVAALLDGETGEGMDERLVTVITTEGPVEVAFGALSESIE